MPALFGPMLATSSPDGLAAWRAVVGEFRRTVEDPLAGWPVIVGIAIGIAVIWVNIRVARALLASLDAHAHHGGPDPVDHAR
tara:strand:+ start:605 stop:850 length:246 start_codon:yes stop_codon:yes gene_type:complete